VPRRLLALAAVAAFALVATAGCANDVSPAARVGGVKIGNDALLDEVAEWNNSTTLLSFFQLAAVPEGGAQRYPMSFVDVVLTNRISFELHKAKFEELGLELTKQDIDDMRAGLIGDEGQSAKVLRELSNAYGKRLVEDVARQAAVANALGDKYEEWARDAFASTGIEVSPRYGTWDPKTAQITAPKDPNAAPTATAGS
jgi:hypothetical protein